MPHKARLVFIRERVIAAIIFYGIALLLLILAFFAADGEAGRYLFDGGLIPAATATGALPSSIRKRGPD